MDQESTTPTAAGSTWAFVTHRAVTWRQAGEGSAVMAVGVASAVLVAASVKVVRLFLDRRR